MSQSYELRTAAQFGQAIRRARRAAGLRQRDLALSAGVGERFIVELEKGKVTARLGKALEVAALLGLGITARVPESDDA